MTAMPQNLKRRDAEASSVLNLCFHGIGTPGRVLESGEDELWIEPAQFEELLDVIVRFPSIRITFDDGNISDVSLALPALLRRNMDAAFFIIAGRTGQSGSLDTANIRTLAKAGMIVGSHGVSHRPWRVLSTQELHQELTSAQETIAAAAGKPVDQVACPLGSYDRRVLNAVRSHGYSRVYTVDGLPAKSGAWLQPRYTIRADDSPHDIELRARLSNSKPFSAAVQAGKSLVKRWR
jgi:peptidoglycan/xylan/chitin deacetylase (PgdA/CDA1 family)